MNEPRVCKDQGDSRPRGWVSLQELFDEITGVCGAEASVRGHLLADCALTCGEPFGFIVLSENDLFPHDFLVIVIERQGADE